MEDLVSRHQVWTYDGTAGLITPRPLAEMCDRAAIGRARNCQGCCSAADRAAFRRTAAQLLERAEAEVRQRPTEAV
jgi:hypothetical protein